MELTIRTEFDTAAACELYGLDADQVARRFDRAPPIGHWFGYDKRGVPVGVAVAAVRPDRRIFVTHRLRSEMAFHPLLDAALRAITGPVNVTVRAGHTERLHAVQSSGLRREFCSVTYDVPFAPALDALPTPRATASFHLAQVTDVDRDELFALDTALRRDVPGNDGWQGNRDWFDDELRSSECDPAGYLVAIDSGTADLIGLCRMWRNADGPALGMLGVRRSRRHGFVALGLLRATLVASSAWGWPTFTTHTARAGLQQHLQRIGATPSGRYWRFTRP